MPRRPGPISNGGNRRASRCYWNLLERRRALGRLRLSREHTAIAVSALGIVADAANGLIEALQRQSSQKVDLQRKAQTRGGEQRRYRRSTGSSNAKDGRTRPSLRRSKVSRSSTETVTALVQSNPSSEARGRREPTAKMVAYAQMLARSRKADLPDNYQHDFDVCRRFLDDHAK